MIRACLRSGWVVGLVILDVSKYRTACSLLGLLDLKVTAEVQPKLRTARNSATSQKTQLRGSPATQNIIF